MVHNTYDGVDLNYLMRNTYALEAKNIDDFKQRVTNVWAVDLDNIDIETIDFWIENRKYVQRDRVIKHILFSRIENWITIKGQLAEYDQLLQKSVAALEKRLKDKEGEFVFIWWWF